VPRIRSLKPDFFRDEKLQDVEAANPGKNCMLVFAGLWPQCDKNGAFPWSSRTLHLDILPFLQFDFDATLSLLSEAGVISRYIAADGRQYGLVVNFHKHQRISGKEAQEPAKFPPPFTEKQPGITSEASGMAGRERVYGVGKGVGNEASPPDQQHPLNHARRIMEVLGLSERILRSVEAGLIAECSLTGNDAAETAQYIVNIALEQRHRGVAIDKFWFDDTKWRNGNGPHKSGRAEPTVQVERAFNNIAAVATVFGGGDSPSAKNGRPTVEHPRLGDGAGQKARPCAAQPPILDGEIKRRS